MLVSRGHRSETEKHRQYCVNTRPWVSALVSPGQSLAVASQLEAEHTSNLPQPFAARIILCQISSRLTFLGCSLPVRCSATSTECTSAQFCHLTHWIPSLLIRGRHSKDSFKNIWCLCACVCICTHVLSAHLHADVHACRCM